MGGNLVFGGVFETFVSYFHIILCLYGGGCLT